jgi:hypothetical protein
MKQDKKEIKRIGVVSAMKISALFAIVMAVFQFLYFLVLKLIPSISIQMGISTASLTWGNVAVFIVQGAISFVVISIVAVALYNLFARMIGGLKIVLD